MGMAASFGDSNGAFERVVEQKDANVEELSVCEVNTGVLAAKSQNLNSWLARVTNDNAQGEYYLPDVLGLAVSDGHSVEVVVTDDEVETQGVNDRIQLEALERSLQIRQAEALMARGVYLSDKSRFDLRGELDCAEDVSIDVNVLIEGHVRIVITWCRHRSKLRAQGLHDRRRRRCPCFLAYRGRDGRARLPNWALCPTATGRRAFGKGQGWKLC